MFKKLKEFFFGAPEAVVVVAPYKVAEPVAVVVAAPPVVVAEPVAVVVAAPVVVTAKAPKAKAPKVVKPKVEVIKVKQAVKAPVAKPVKVVAKPVKVVAKTAAKKLVPVTKPAAIKTKSKKA